MEPADPKVSAVVNIHCEPQLDVQPTSESLTVTGAGKWHSLGPCNPKTKRKPMEYIRVKFPNPNCVEQSATDLGYEMSQADAQKLAIRLCKAGTNAKVTK